MTQTAFRYQAINAKGARSKGVVRAVNRQEAYRQIVAAKMKPLRITGGDHRRAKKISLKDLSHFTHQFAVLIEARIAIVDGLRCIAEQEQNKPLRVVVEDVAGQIEAGCTVYEALAPHRRLFGDVYVETVRAAESTGNMVQVLAHLATMLERQYEMAKNIKSALMYPICVTAALTAAVTFLLIVVVPRFAEMFASQGVELPLATQLLIGLSGLLQGHWYVLLSLGAGAYWLLRRAWRSALWRKKIDAVVHRVPLLRSLLQGMAISRFAGILAISLRSGLNLIDALEMAGRASGRPLLQADADKLKNQVNSGGRLTEIMRDCSYIPGFARRMITAGEEAGELPKMCEIVARNYDREVMYLAKNVTTVVEPVLVVGLAGVVLIVALAIFLPMWDMTALIR